MPFVIHKTPKAIKSNQQRHRKAIEVLGSIRKRPVLDTVHIKIRCMNCSSGYCGHFRIGKCGGSMRNRSCFSAISSTDVFCCDIAVLTPPCYLKTAFLLRASCKGPLRIRIFRWTNAVQDIVGIAGRKSQLQTVSSGSVHHQNIAGSRTRDIVRRILPP